MKILVGNTGLIGQTISQYEEFNYTFNSKNINQFIDTVPDGCELFLTCLPATKWMVNKDLKQDINNINNIINIVSKKSYSKVIVISTIDVYNDSPMKSNEDYSPNISKLSYGNNRYLFELLIREFVKTDDLKIFRLPALFNNKIKKNVLYDLINNNNVNQINSNSSFQWYNLNNLSTDIKKYSEKFKNETLFNIFTEPLDTKDIISLFPRHENNVTFLENRVVYDYTTKFNGTGYISSKTMVLLEIKNLINELSIK